MIMSSGRFSSGGGGGSNRDVVFTAKFQVDPKARQELENFGNRIDDVARKAANIRLGASGGIAGSGRPGAGGRAGGASVTGPIVFDDAAESRRQAQFFDRAIREEQRILKQNAAERAKDLRMLKKDTKDVMEGMIGLSRAFVLFGVSSEENLEKAVRALAKFEGAIAGIKGGMKLSEGLGGLLGRVAPRTGLAAGASGMTLGAAGVAAGVGVLGGGLAIADLLRFNTTGKIGTYSQGYADKYASFLRWQYGGDTDRLSNLYGVDRPFGQLAASQIGLERQTAGNLSAMETRLRNSQQTLATERQILAAMEQQATAMRNVSERAQNRLQNVAAAFQSLSPLDREAVSRLRDRFLKNPESVGGRGLNALYAFGSEQMQAEIDRQRVQRTRGYFAGGGFDRELEATSRDSRREQAALTREVEWRREIVLKLNNENEELVDQFVNIIGPLLKSSNEQLAQMLQEALDRLMQEQRQLQREQQGRVNATLNAGQGAGFGG